MRSATSLIRTSLLTSIALSGLAFSGAAFAQNTATADASSEDLIIVTASKRTATLQDTPISVSVTGKEAIQRAQIRDLKDLSTLVPSLRVSQLQSSANTNFIIRGFGNGANNAGIEPSVGVFIDGVYRSRSAAQIGDLPNLERVEVLRGPQSTLFGKNASAGIISIVTREPQFELGGDAEVSYGNYNAIIAKASITGPITDKIAFSLAANMNKRDGYAQDLNLKTDVNDRNRYGVRGSLLFKPTDDFKLRLIADYDKIDENCCIAANVVDGDTGNAVRALGGKIDSRNPFSYNIYNNVLSSNNIENYGVSAQSDWNMNDTLALTAIGSYRAVRVKTNQDSDFTSADLIGENSANTRINTYTAEVRLASSYDSFFNFLVGGYYFRENIASEGQLTFGKDFRNYASLLSDGKYTALEAPLGLPVGTFGGQGQGRFEDYDYKNRAFSFFGQADFQLAEGLVFTAGGNYTNDRKTVISNNRVTDVFSSLDLAGIGAAAFGIPAQFANNPAVNPLLALRPLQFIPPFLNFPNAVEDGKTSDDKFTYTLRLAYKINSNFSTYATYATGFKASSFNLGIDSRPFAKDFIPGPAITNPAASAIRTAGLALNNLTIGTRYADPENAQVFEVGLKGQLEGFAFNVAVFKQALKGFQGNVFVGTGFVLSNAEKQSTFGVELDTVLTPVKNFNVTFNLTYLNPKYDSYKGGSATTSGFVNVATDLSGLRPAGIPEFSLSVGSTYTHEFSDTLKAIFHLDYNYESPVAILDGLPQIKREVQGLNGAVSLDIGKGLELTVWGRNIANSQYLTTIFPSVAQLGSLSGYPSQPRTYGGAIRYRF
jgi:outer membrane receptor protein involved in Fe transport